MSNEDMVPLPHLFFVPGFFESPAVYDTVIDILSRKGYNHTVAWIESRNNTNAEDEDESRYNFANDTIGVRRTLELLVVEEELDVVMVAHSAGGLWGPNAMEGLSEKARRAKGLKGGVRNIIFLAAAVGPEGRVGGMRGVMGDRLARFEGDRVYPRMPWEHFFNDITDEREFERHAGHFAAFPRFHWGTPITYCGYKDVPSAYVLCAKDMAIYAHEQEEHANRAGSEIVRIDAAHMPMITAPQMVADIIAKYAS